MIIAEKKAPSTTNMAERIEDELFKGWLTKSLNPEDVIMHLKLNQAGETVFQSPLWDMYTKFLERYSKTFPTKQSTVISALARGYDDDALSTLLIAVKKVPSTEKLATKLQADQIQCWLEDKDPPDEIFKALMLDDAADDVITNPLFSTWTTYLDEFNAKFPNEKVTIIDTLRTNVDDQSFINILVKLQADQLQRWLANEESPKSVFIALRLDDTVDGVLASPLLNTWAAYLEQFEAKFPKSKVSMVDTFREFFGDKSPAKMLIAAKEVESTKRVATSLQGSLVNKWILARKTPKSVSTLLGADEESEKLLTIYSTKYTVTYGRDFARLNNLFGSAGRCLLY